MHGSDSGMGRTPSKVLTISTQYYEIFQYLFMYFDLKNALELIYVSSKYLLFDDPRGRPFLPLPPLKYIVLKWFHAGHHYLCPIKCKLHSPW